MPLGTAQLPMNSGKHLMGCLSLFGKQFKLVLKSHGLQWDAEFKHFLDILMYDFPSTCPTGKDSRHSIAFYNMGILSLPGGFLFCAHVAVSPPNNILPSLCIVQGAEPTLWVSVSKWIWSLIREGIEGILWGFTRWWLKNINYEMLNMLFLSNIALHQHGWVYLVFFCLLVILINQVKMMPLYNHYERRLSGEKYKKKTACYCTLQKTKKQRCLQGWVRKQNL